VTCFCEHGNEPSDGTKVGSLIELLAFHERLSCMQLIWLVYKSER
jgi:hypothetical protein